MASSEDEKSHSGDEKEDRKLKSIPSANYQVHTFKLKTFSHPVWCAHCKDFVWGVYKQGYYCKACGMVVHKDCRLSVPAPCPGKKGADASMDVNIPPTESTS